MATALDIINRAFRKIGVKAEDEALTPDQIEHGLGAYNSMLSGWRLRGMDILHEEGDASAAFPLPPEFVQPVVHLLAAEIAPDYGRPVDFEVRSHRNAIRNVLREEREPVIDRALLDVSRRRFWQGY